MHARRVGTRLLALLALVAGTALGAAPLAYRNVTVTPIGVTSVFLTQGVTYTFATRNTSLGGDPVLHVWGPRVVNGVSQGTKDLGHDDDSAGGGNARVTVTPTATAWHQLILHGHSSSSFGFTEVTQNGVQVGTSAVSFGGTTLAVRPGTAAQYAYESAPVPGGTQDTLLWAMDCSGALLASDDWGGVGGMARLSGVAGVCWVVMDARVTGGTRASLYTNDVTADLDGDGLGAQLEQALLTCDSRAQSGCADVANPKDTDRDGLEDGIEVFGLDVLQAQLFPAWGADPRHKDAFVEMDWWAGKGGFSAQPLGTAFGKAVQDIYLEGSATDLGNPDGLPGIRFHFDIGKAPANPTDTTVGNWGGSNGITIGNPFVDYRPAADTQMISVRHGLFRHGYMVPGDGAGNGGGDRFSVGISASNNFPASIAHELGHTFKLGHGGHTTWANVNCKPNYQSIMNYAFGGTHFSQGRSTVALNPTSVFEGAGVGTDAGYLGSDPWNFGVASNGSVDFNRSGPIDAPNVRAPVTLADSECNAMDQNFTRLRKSGVGAALPEIVRWVDRLYVFYVGSDGKLYYRSGKTSGAADSKGSCPLGDAQATEGGCMTFDAEFSVPVARRATSVSAIRQGSGGLLVAYRTDTSAVRTVRATGIGTAGDLIGWTDDREVLIRADGEPELANLPVDPARFGSETQVIALFYSSFGVYQWMTTPDANGAWTGRGAVVLSDGTALKGSKVGTVVPWPAVSPTTSCGAFADASDVVGLYCFDKATDRFVRAATGTAFKQGAPTTLGKPGLAFHLARSASGAALGDGVTGAFWLTWSATEPRGGATPHVYISSPVSQTKPPTAGVSFVHSAHVATHWALAPNVAATLWEDNAVSALKGARLHSFDVPLSDGGTATDNRVEFLPLADGTFFNTLKDGNDFQVMERGLCLNLKGDNGDALCGGPNAFGY